MNRAGPARSGPLDSKLVCQQSGCMKVTVDLPDDLVRQLKLRAVHEGRKLKEVAAEALRCGLGASSAVGEKVKRRRVRLPLVAAPPGTAKARVSGEDVDRALSEQEARWADEVAGR